MNKNNSQPVLLIYPPPSDPTQPYSSLPVLTGVLRDSGFKVCQKDLGVIIIDKMLTHEYLTNILKLAYQKKEEMNEEIDEDFYSKFKEIIGFSEYLIDNVDDAKNVMRDPSQFYDIPRYQWASNVLNLACELISLAHFPEILTPCEYRNDIKYVSHDLWEVTSNNVFFDIFKNEIVPSLTSLKPLLVGISVTYFSQIIPAFTLSRLIKELHPNLHITIGGAMISLMNQQIIQDKGFFKFADSFVIGEGETALLELTKSISSNSGFDSVPNLITLNSDSKSNKRKMWIQEDLNNLPPPDFEGLELNRYFSPEPVFLLSTSRGCYHGQCAFCNVSMNTRKIFRIMKKKNLLSLIQNLHSKYGVRRFFFCDDALPLKNMLAVSDLVRNRLSLITWAGEARFESTLSHEKLSLMKDGGCRELIFGLESVSQRVLNLMNKNNTIENDLRILRVCKELGIAVNVQTFIGFPTETREEAQKTIDFLIENENLINSTGFSYFCLYRDTPVFNYPERFGINNISQAFGLRYNFEQLSGITSGEIDKVFTKTNKILDKIYSYKAKYLSKVSGAHTLLHLSHYGLDELNKLLSEQKKTNVNKTDFLSLTPILSPNLLFSTRNPSTNSKKIRIMNTITGDDFFISQDEYQLLNLCDGNLSVSKIAQLWSGKCTQNILKFTKSLVMLKELIEKDIILSHFK